MDRRELIRFEVPLGVCGAAAVALAFVFAMHGVPGWIPPAPSVRIGIPSPFSGMTRSFVALASGDPGSAFRWHPLGPAAFAAAVVAPVMAAWAWARGSRPRWVARALASRAAWLAAGVVFAAAWARQIFVLG